MSYVVSQFAHPRGVLGVVAGKIMARSNQARNEHLLKLLELQPTDQVLEIGFGPGVAIQQAAQVVTQGHVTGVDRSETMVRQARKRNAAAIQAGRVTLRQGSVETLAHPENSFDKVYASNVFQFWSEPIETLQAIQGLLKPGGRIIIALQPRWVKTDEAVRHVGEEVKTQLLLAGFQHLSLTFKPMKPMMCLYVVGEVY